MPFASFGRSMMTCVVDRYPGITLHGLRAEDVSDHRLAFLVAHADGEAIDIARLTTQLGYEIAQSTAAARLSRILSRQDQQFAVADLDGRPVGWVHAAISEYIEAEAFVVIGGLVVDKNHRRNGIGRRLMEEVEEWARKRGCSVVRLWSSSARTDAHRF
jgi:GNAT superfamily N-acetyltransferase